MPPRDVEGFAEVRVDVDGRGGRGAEPEVVGDGLVAVGVGSLGGEAKVLGRALCVRMGDYGEAGETGVREPYRFLLALVRVRRLG